MIGAIITISLAFIWLLRETDWLRVHLPVGVIPYPLQLVRLDWEVCVSRYGNLKLSPGVNPICGWEWLMQNTHPVPQVVIDFTSGGVRYHWHIKDLSILKSAITATHAKPRPSNGKRAVRRNKWGGLVADLPAKAR